MHLDTRLDRHAVLSMTGTTDTTDTTDTNTNNTNNTNNNTPWPFWLKIAHTLIEKCVSLMVKSLRKFLMGRQVTRSRGAPPAPVVEYVTPVPAVFQAPTPVVESIAPVLVVFHAPVFPLSPDLP